MQLFLPSTLTGKCIASTPHILEVETDEVISIQNLKLVLIPTVHFNDGVKPVQVLLTLINLSDDLIQIAKHTVIGTLWLYANDQELQQDFIIYHLNVEKSDTNLSYTSPSAKFICSLAEVKCIEKSILDHTPQSQETQKALDKLCEE